MSIAASGVKISALFSAFPGGVYTSGLSSVHVNRDVTQYRRKCCSQVEALIRIRRCGQHMSHHITANSRDCDQTMIVE